MKKIFYFIILLFGAIVVNTACDDWTEIETLHSQPMSGSSMSEDYYAKLLQKSEMRKDIVIELSYKGFG